MSYRPTLEKKHGATQFSSWKSYKLYYNPKRKRYDNERCKKWISRRSSHFLTAGILKLAVIFSNHQAFTFFSFSLCDAFEVKTNPFLNKKIERKKLNSMAVSSRKKNIATLNCTRETNLSTTTYSKKEEVFPQKKTY